LSKRALWWVGVAALLLLSPLAFSQNTVQLTLDNGGPYTMDGVYVGPYNATQSVNNGPGQNVQIICDDFEHEVNPNESWAANVTSVSNLPNGTGGLTWSNGTAGAGLGFSGVGVLQGYLAMAYLASEMLPLSGNPANAQQVGYMAYAIWAVFDAQAVENWLVNTYHDPNAWACVESLAQGALTLAVKGDLSAAQFAGWEILTPNCSGASCPQEFFEFVPEGGTALSYLLLAGFACFGTMYFKSRRRHASGVV
jgi:hypothetical protein